MDYFSLGGDDWKMKEFLGEDWVWRDAHKRETQDRRWWKPGRVPGSVADDLFRSGMIPDPYYGRNSLLIEWIPARTWVYRKTFTLPEEMRDKSIMLCFQGVDYEAKVYLNDILLGSHVGMFTPFCLDVTDVIDRNGQNLLAVVIEKAPEEQPQVSKTRYVRTHKSRMTYWWDFCPRMIHQGIWQEVCLEAFGEVRIGQITAESELLSAAGTKAREVMTAFTESPARLISATGTKARVQVAVELEKRTGVPVREIEIGCEISLKGICCEKAARRIKIYHEKEAVFFHFILDQPALWWPAGYGGQPLYDIRVQVWEAEVSGQRTLSEGAELSQKSQPSRLSRLSQEKSISIGIREVRFVENEGAEPGAKPYTLTVNGRKILMKGWNWVPMDVMYGVKREAKLAHLIKLAAEAHVNIFRVWGGGLIETEEFYQQCDRQGIMIWQEFIQSSSGIENKPSEAPEFLALMEQEAEQIIPARKNHPSLVIWGGGNELQSGEEKMIQDTEPVIRVLENQVKKLDKTRYFLASSPTGRIFSNTLENIRRDPDGLHDVHGPWEHQGLTGQYELYNRGTSLMSSEFGVEGMANEAVLRRCMPAEHLWPPSRDNGFYFHRGSWWNNYPLLQECFENEIKTVEAAVKASQFLQYEGLKYAVEANRRRALHISGIFPWQFQEPYPNNTCTSSVDYYGFPKPAYYGVRKAYEETVATAEFSGQSLRGQSHFAAGIHLQTARPTCQARITAQLTDSRGKVLKKEGFTAQAGAESGVCAGNISCEIDNIKTELFFLNLFMKINEKGEADVDGYTKTETETGQVVNRYLFTKTSLAPLLRLEPAKLKITVRGEKISLLNTGTECAVGIKLEDAEEPDEVHFAYFDENYFHLFPGESRVVTAVKAVVAWRCRISAFNLLPRDIVMGAEVSLTY